MLLQFGKKLETLCEMLTGSPCVDEVLGKADVGGGSCNGDLALWWPFHGISYFDLRSRHLTDLVDFGSLAPDYAAY